MFAFGFLGEVLGGEEATLLSDEDEDSFATFDERASEARQLRAVRAFTVERLREAAPDFYEDDVRRGAQVLEAAAALVGALSARQRVITGTMHGGQLIEDVVRLVQTHESGPVATAERFAEAIERLSARDAGGGGVITRLADPAPFVDRVVDRIEAAWRRALSQYLAGALTQLTVSHSHRRLPKRVYERWMKRRALATKGVRGGQLNLLDVAYPLRSADAGLEGLFLFGMGVIGLSHAGMEFQGHAGQPIALDTVQLASCSGK